MMSIDHKHMIAIVVLILISSCVATPSKIILPDGWALPSETMTNAVWRNKDKNRYLVASGDYNGDGTLDEARLLVHKDGSEMGFFVFLSKGKKYKVFELDRKSTVELLKPLGIELVPPGRYETACAKGFVECHDGDPRELVLSREGINYFKQGSASMYFYWDEKTDSFVGVGIND